MRVRYCVLLLLSITAFALQSNGIKAQPKASANAPIIGKWFTEGNLSIIEFYECQGKICGKIVWAKEPNDKYGKPKRDVNNPEPSKRNALLIGLPMLSNLTYVEPYNWRDGRVYDPEHGRTYSCKVTVEGNLMKLRGYIWGMPFFGKTNTWVRTK